MKITQMWKLHKNKVPVALLRIHCVMKDYGELNFSSQQKNWYPDRSRNAEYLRRSNHRSHSKSSFHSHWRIFIKKDSNPEFDMLSKSFMGLTCLKSREWSGLCRSSFPIGSVDWICVFRWVMRQFCRVLHHCRILSDWEIQDFLSVPASNFA